MERYKNAYKSDGRELISLSVYNVGSEKCDSSYQWGPGIRDHYLIHYIISGKGNYRVAGGPPHELNAGDVFLVYPNTEVIYQADSQDPWEYVWVGFNGTDAATILGATDFSPEQPYLHRVPYGESVKRQILHIYEASGTHFENAVEMTGRLYTTLAIFMQEASKQPFSSSAKEYVQKAIDFITANYSYPLTIEDIAAFVGLSRSQLFRSFQTVLEISPKEYLTEFRIKRACQLLEGTSLTVTAVANSVGFENSLYFSKAFHKVTGTSPSNHRKKALNRKSFVQMNEASNLI